MKNVLFGLLAAAVLIMVVQVVHHSIVAAPNVSHLEEDMAAREVFMAVNNQRVKDGLPPLALDTRLGLAAAAKLKDMFRAGYFDHVSPSGEDYRHWMEEAQYPFADSGENIGRGYDSTSDLVQAWMESQEHRDNILNPAYVDTGIAVGQGYVVQMFANKPD